MANNSSSSCAESITAAQIATSGLFRDGASLFVYRFWYPVNAMFGILGNSFSLPVMVRLSGDNKAFLLQTVLVINDLICCVGFFIYNIFVPNLRVLWNLGPSWLHAKYPLVKFGTQIAPVANMFITTGIYFVLATAFYRAYALQCPHAYSGIKHKKHMVVVSVVCFAVGILTSLHDCFRYEIQYCDELHMFYVAGFELGLFFKFCELLRVFIRIAGMVTLYVMAGVVSVLYKKTQTHHRSMASSGQHHSTQAVDAGLLTTLLVIQASTVLIGYTPLVMVYIVIYFPDWFYEGTLMIMWVLCDFGAAIGLTWNFWFYAGTSKKFRNMLKEVVLCRKNQVVPAQSTKNVTATTRRSRSERLQRKTKEPTVPGQLEEL